MEFREKDTHIGNRLLRYRLERECAAFCAGETPYSAVGAGRLYGLESVRENSAVPLGLNPFARFPWN
jgi:hypothetical protein